MTLPVYKDSSSSDRHVLGCSVTQYRSVYLLIRNQSILHNNVTALHSSQPAAVAASSRRDTAEFINDTTHAPTQYTRTLTDLLFVENLHGVKGLGRFVLNQHHAPKWTSAECAYSIKLVESGIVLQLSPTQSSSPLAPQQQQLTIR